MKFKMKKGSFIIIKILIILSLSIFVSSNIIFATDTQESVKIEENDKKVQASSNDDSQKINQEKDSKTSETKTNEKASTENNSKTEEKEEKEQTEQTEKTEEKNANNQTSEDNKNEVDKLKVIQDGKYIIKSAINEKYVFDIYNNSKTNGANLELWENYKENNQKFNVKYLGNGEYSICAVHSNKSLDVEGNAKKMGTNVIQWDSNNQDNQKWLIKMAGNGSYKIISKSSKLCLDIPYGDAKSGANVQVWADNGGKNQMFKFELVKEETNGNNNNNNNNNTTPQVITGNKTIESGKYIIKSAINQDCVFDVYDGLLTSGAKLGLWYNNKGDNQKFEIKYLGNGEYSIIAMHSNKALDVEGNSKIAGTNVIQWDSNNQDNQKWIIKDLKNGYYKIISKSSYLCIDIPNGKDISGANLQVRLENNEKSQMFKFEPISQKELNNFETKTIDDGMYCIKTLVDNESVLDIYNQSRDNGANVEIWYNNSNLNQKFDIKYMNDGTYTICAVHSGKYLDVEGASKKSGANVLQWEYNGNNNQRWIIKKVTSEKYNIISKDSGLYLTVDSGNVCIKEQNYTNSQYFSFGKTKLKVETGTYGISGLKLKGDSRGTDLKYYKIGSGPNVFFATFAIHGWEDDFNYDGKELTKIAEKFKEEIASNNDASLASKWTIYIFPSVNPDGEYYGWTHNGPGRTTLYSADKNHKGIDMNRTWSTDWVKYTTDRNYTGIEPFQAYEARYLRDFLLSHKATNGQTVLVDLHGWLNETMGDDKISSYYSAQLGMSKHIASYGRGYLINWARANLGANGKTARTALIELPEAQSSADVSNWKLADKYIKATINMLRDI